MIADSQTYIFRCIELAQNSSGTTAPNPMVGAVLVYKDRIIGEGYHHSFGGPHAEVNAINNAIEKGFENLLENSILYVSLEPCSHTGKTAPCTNRIIKHKIPHVVIGCMDPFPDVNGRGIKTLQSAGVKVETGVLEKECMELNRRFITFHTKKRPYILLKFAQTANHFIAPLEGADKKISNDFSDILVHKWRSEESAIMVGTRTAEADNPSLTVRKWKGKNPVRFVIDRNLRLPKNLSIFDHSAPTVLFNEVKSETGKNTDYIKIDFNEKVCEQICTSLYERNILSVMIEGGKNLLKQFIENNLWDEARIITAEKFFSDGIKSPKIDGRIISSSTKTGDHIVILRPNQ